LNAKVKDGRIGDRSWSLTLLGGPVRGGGSIKLLSMDAMRQDL
jgi:hypothetical protein